MKNPKGPLNAFWCDKVYGGSSGNLQFSFGDDPGDEGISTGISSQSMLTLNALMHPYRMELSG